MAEEKKVPVSERALIARINRKLGKAEPWPLKLCKARPGSMAENNLGTYHIINTYQNSLQYSRIEDLEKWVRENHPELLKPWEFYLGGLSTEELAGDFGEEVRMDDLGLDGFDTSTPEGKAAFKARLTVVKREIALLQETNRRFKQAIREVKKNNN